MTKWMGPVLTWPMQVAPSLTGVLAARTLHLYILAFSFLVNLALYYSCNYLEFWLPVPRTFLNAVSGIIAKHCCFSRTPRRHHADVSIQHRLWNVCPAVSQDDSFKLYVGCGTCRHGSATCRLHEHLFGMQRWH